MEAKRGNSYCGIRYGTFPKMGPLGSTLHYSVLSPIPS